MSLRPPEIVLSELERTELERLVRTHTAAQQLVTRACIILGAGDGQNNAQIARWLGLDDETPGFWRQRWLQFRDGRWRKSVWPSGWPMPRDRVLRRSSRLSRCAR